MKSLVLYFASRPVVANIVMFGLILSAILLWPQMGKEEMPEFTMEWLNASLSYPGASARDVEAFVTKPVEEKIKGVSGLREVSSTSSYGSSTFQIILEPNTQNLPEKIQDIKDAIESTDLPQEVEDPVYRQFRSSEKAIIDVGVFLKSEKILDINSRTELQEYALAFKNKLISLPEISGLESEGYLVPELQIKVKPEKLAQYEVSMNQVKEAIVEKNIRSPIGSLEDESESEVSIVSELDDIDSLKEVIVQSSFSGNQLRLKDLATVSHGFEKNNTVIKIQGREGILFNVQKSSNTDILSAQKAVVQFIDDFKQTHSDSGVDFVLIDDESYDVRNRLSLIGVNGIIGFFLIVLVLFCFLDLKSGIWAAMGIPFSLAFTLIASMVLGYTVNNMTLAAIIVVLGIVVDDAIIVVENITRRKQSGSKDVIQPTLEVVSPIIASVLTTCVAFIPLLFFSGRFGMFVKYLPVIISLMLLASLFESFFILPSHMSQSFKGSEKMKAWDLNQKIAQYRMKFMTLLEEIYQKMLRKTLSYRGLVLLGFVGLLVASGYLFSSQLSYVMFPREESKDFRVKVVVTDGANRYQTANLIQPLEESFLKHPLVTSVSSYIGQSRRGGEVRENEASLRVEVVPPSERKVSLNEMLAGWEKEFEKLEGFQEIRFQKSRFGSDSGSAIGIQVLENKDQDRTEVVSRLKKQLEEFPSLENVEIERPVEKNEYRLEIRRAEASRLGVNYNDLAGVLRSYIEGDILYTLNADEEEVDVRFTSDHQSKNTIEGLMDLTIANQEGYLVPLRGLIDLHQGKKPANIQRINYKRTTSLFADIKPEAKVTPLEVAETLETNVFSKVISGFPSTALSFSGEIADSRESQDDFMLSIILVLALIYVVLVFLFDSLWTPLLIGLIIPFGMVGTIWAFWLHGFNHYGFFAVVGTLGMMGVVINDSIVLIDKYESSGKTSSFIDLVVDVSASRLRAVMVTTLTTVAGLFPTAYGLGGYDSMLAEMMLAMGWGLLFGMFITLVLVPCVYSYYLQFKWWKEGGRA